jgi:Zn-dependent peptidase ImmA (M78 family)
MLNDINFKMLTLAREARGKTQLELVENVPNLNQGNYSKMEKGLLSVPVETLKNIAQALNFPESFFYKKEPVHEPGNHYYRKRASLSRKIQTTIEGNIKCLMVWTDSLLEDIEIPEFKLPSLEVTADNTPTVIARKIRKYLNIPPGPIDNLVRLIEKSGVIVYFLKNASEKFDGMTIFTNSGQPMVFINEVLSNDRKRFTLAHELGHLIMHLRSELLDSVDKELEDQANEFASEFLIPYLDSRADLTNLRFKDLGVLKQYWKVSKAALMYQAYKRNFIDYGKYQNMLIEMSKQGERKKESMDVDIDKPVMLSKVAEAYQHDLGYSMKEIEATIGVSEYDYNFFLKQMQVSNKLKLVF